MSFILWSVLMRRLAILLVLLATAAWSTSSGVTRVAAFSGSSSAALSSYLQGAVSRGEIPGVVVAAVGPGRLLYHEAYGTMNAARKVPMAKDAIFNIASMTKPVTSIAIMMLVEEGKLRLDDDVSKFLPKFANPSAVFPKLWSPLLSDYSSPFPLSGCSTTLTPR
jgi:CubicO group peptidase (beta-lactamase class C family)